ncbi:hypothetical protein M3Y97_00269900 [Aphelenchoides bicaudatus]|nr:hypothetical protein M3Y97_00269900 [Aphelenchoides bicaudatus]
MERELMEKIFVSCLIILLSIGNVMMGCELDLKVVWSTLRRPIAPAIGFFTQFVLMPTLAYAIANLLLVERGMYLFALGLFVTGCAPAGGASNFWTLLLNGNAHLSVTMTLISNVGSLFMMPFWMNLLGYKFLEMHPTSVVMKVPYSRIIASLGGLIVPLLIGILINRWKPNWGAKARRVLRPFVIFVLAFVIIFGTIINYHMFAQISWPAVISGLLLPLFGFMCGCFSSILLRQPPENVTAIAIETGVQNTGIAIMVLKVSFSGTDAADISIMLPILVACFTPGPLLFGYAIHKLVDLKKRRQRCKNAPEQSAVAETLYSKGEERIALQLESGTPNNSNVPSNAKISLSDDTQSTNQEHN